MNWKTVQLFSTDGSNNSVNFMRPQQWTSGEQSKRFKKVLGNNLENKRSDKTGTVKRNKRRRGEGGGEKCDPP